MLAGFWDSVGGKLAERWAAFAGPALVFWAAVMLAWVGNRSGAADVRARLDWLDRQSASVQVAVLITVLAVVVASGLLVNVLTTPMLRLLEGYWPSGAEPVRRRLVGRARDRQRIDAETFQGLIARREDLRATIAAEPESVGFLEDELGAVARDLAEVETRSRLRPPSPSLMPTRIGNILRAAELRPAQRYGLDAVVVWPHLWLLLPDIVRSELARARQALDATVAAVVWAVAYCLFAVLAWWTVPAGLLIAAIVVAWWIPGRAQIFAELLDAAFDLHRGELYAQLRWPLPDTPQEELLSGELLTQYLWRGTPPPGLRFGQADEPTSGKEA